MSKSLIRTKMRQKRKSLPESIILENSKSIQNYINNKINLASPCKIGYFSPFENEPIISFDSKHQIYLPKIEDKVLEFYEESPKMQKNKYGIDEPSNSNKIDLAKLDIILVPFLAFNKNLYRVGFGGGFYDKTLCRLSNLTKRPKIWGVGFSFQLTKENFQENLDVRLDKIITEQHIYE